jgi:hypothetical protein
MPHLPIVFLPEEHFLSMIHIAAAVVQSRSAVIPSPRYKMDCEKLVGSKEAGYCTSPQVYVRS